MFTDFGHQGPYMGQMEAVLTRLAPDIRVLSLMSDAPCFNAKASAYLLASMTATFPIGTVFLCVVDPGVGSLRVPLMLNADGNWYVGPDNGLLNIVARHATEAKWYEILWRPNQISSSFHGRDLFAPVAAYLAQGEMPANTVCKPTAGYDWPDDLAEVIYIDHYGNLFTGMRSELFASNKSIEIAGFKPVHARTFSEASPGSLIWYANSNGLVEIALNQGSAAQYLNAGIGTRLTTTF